MKRFLVLLALALVAPGCTADVVDEPSAEDATEDPITLATDTKIKNAVLKASAGLWFTSESDHELVWVRSSTVAPGPANAWFVHKSFNKVTDGDTMADKPLSALKSETVPFEAFAARYKPVAGEDPDNFAYHQRLTAVLDVMRANLKNPVVIRLGRPSGSGLVGAISVYILGTLPSGKVGGLFTVAVET